MLNYVNVARTECKLKVPLGQVMLRYVMFGNYLLECVVLSLGTFFVSLKCLSLYLLKCHVNMTIVLINECYDESYICICGALCDWFWNGRF